MKIRPLYDRLIVQRLAEKERTDSGIYIPDNAKEKPIQGIVLSVGQGKVLDDGSVRALDVKNGDKVLFGKYAGTEVELNGEKVLVLREEDVLGVLEE